MSENSEYVQEYDDYVIAFVEEQQDFSTLCEDILNKEEWNDVVSEIRANDVRGQVLSNQHQRSNRKGLEWHGRARRATREGLTLD